MPNENWNAPFIFTGSILVAYFIDQKTWLRFFKLALLSLLGLVSLVVLVCNTFPELNPSSAPGRGEIAILRQLSKAIPNNYYKNHSIIVDTNTRNYWIPSMLAYFLPKNSGIYALNLQNGHQFYLWWEEKRDSLTPASQVLYITRYNLSEKNPLLKDCRLLMKKDYLQRKVFNKNIPWQFKIYQCEILERTLFHM